MEAHPADLDRSLGGDDVAASFEARMRDLEDERLSPLATRSYPPQRAVEELPAGCAPRSSATATGSSTRRASAG